MKNLDKTIQRFQDGVLKTENELSYNVCIESCSHIPIQPSDTIHVRLKNKNLHLYFLHVMHMVELGFIASHQLPKNLNAENLHVTCEKSDPFFPLLRIAWSIP